MTKRGPKPKPLVELLCRHITINDLPAIDLSVPEYVGIHPRDWPPQLQEKWVWNGAVNRFGTPQSRWGAPGKLLYKIFLPHAQQAGRFVHAQDRRDVNPVHIYFGRRRSLVAARYNYAEVDFEDRTTVSAPPMPKALDYGELLPAEELEDLVETLKSTPITSWEEYQSTFADTFADVTPKNQHEALHRAGLLEKLGPRPQYIINP
jgi:hypothetical protein